MKDEEKVQEIKERLVKEFNALFGFCGLAEGDNLIMLNSGKGNIVVTIKWETENDSN